VRHPCFAATGDDVADAALGCGGEGGTIDADFRISLRAETAFSAARRIRGSSSPPHVSLFRAATGRAAPLRTMDSHAESIDTSLASAGSDAVAAAVAAVGFSSSMCSFLTPGLTTASTAAGGLSSPADFLRTWGRSVGLLVVLASRGCLAETRTGALTASGAAAKASWSDDGKRAYMASDKSPPDEDDAAGPVRWRWEKTKRQTMMTFAVIQRKEVDERTSVGRCAVETNEDAPAVAARKVTTTATIVALTRREQLISGYRLLAS
jgi:hypothetical protein